ncbi:NAD(P)-binding Rossmann-fold superfamily protein [Actinidia rufa]|uniref:NAD(P)-binding Rossmann-fold superfamily protein n=1 Tax=Actinidia rufa TaxID=165716 RepID=A0A7J0G3L1_9ERIC|nr:NAD(P)-binding Rossmann-fold superfamily protein [Actinidia rufa]GFZ05352.1 NAD(P)-binding Rossmann-fold superfamily protein [Actinidia rufa]
MLETVKYLIGSLGPVATASSPPLTKSPTAAEIFAPSPPSSPVSIELHMHSRATVGIGAETARVLAKLGARKARIVSEFPDSEIVLMALDLSSLTSVQSFVAEFEYLNLPLNLLINNAGKFSDGHAISEDGVEMTFATNYLGHFLLTKLLRKKMIETAKVTGIQGRIVNVSSSIHG